MPFLEMYVLLSVMVWRNLLHLYFLTQPQCVWLCFCVQRLCVWLHPYAHTFTLLCACAFNLCLPSPPGDGCCEIRDAPVVFDTPVFWGNSQPGDVDQEDLVMRRKWRKQKYQGANDVMASMMKWYYINRARECCCGAVLLYYCTSNDGTYQHQRLCPWVGCKICHVCTFRLIIYDNEQLCKT